MSSGFRTPPPAQSPARARSSSPLTAIPAPSSPTMAPPSPAAVAKSSAPPSPPVSRAGSGSASGSPTIAVHDLEGASPPTSARKSVPVDSPVDVEAPASPTPSDLDSLFNSPPGSPIAERDPAHVNDAHIERAQQAPPMYSPSTKPTANDTQTFFASPAPSMFAAPTSVAPTFTAGTASVTSARVPRMSKVPETCGISGNKPKGPRKPKIRTMKVVKKTTESGEQVTSYVPVQPAPTAPTSKPSKRRRAIENDDDIATEPTSKRARTLSLLPDTDLDDARNFFEAHAAASKRVTQQEQAGRQRRLDKAAETAAAAKAKKDAEEKAWSWADEHIADMRHYIVPKSQDYFKVGFTMYAITQLIGDAIDCNAYWPHMNIMEEDDDNYHITVRKLTDDQIAILSAANKKKLTAQKAARTRASKKLDEECRGKTHGERVRIMERTKIAGDRIFGSGIKKSTHKRPKRS